MLRCLLFFSAIVILSGCTVSPKRQFEKVKVGMDKNDVLALMDSPQRTQRWKGLDRWTYVYYENDLREEKEVHFSDGKASYVGEVFKPQVSAIDQDKANEESNAQLDALALSQKEDARKNFKSYEDYVSGSDSVPRYVPQFKPLE